MTESLIKRERKLDDRAAYLSSYYYLVGWSSVDAQDD